MSYLELSCNQSRRHPRSRGNGTSDNTKQRSSRIWRCLFSINLALFSSEDDISDISIVWKSETSDRFQDKTGSSSRSALQAKIRQVVEWACAQFYTKKQWKIMWTLPTLVLRQPFRYLVCYFSTWIKRREKLEEFGTGKKVWAPTVLQSIQVGSWKWQVDKQYSLWDTLSRNNFVASNLIGQGLKKKKGKIKAQSEKKARTRNVASCNRRNSTPGLHISKFLLSASEFIDCELSRFVHNPCLESFEHVYNSIILKQRFWKNQQCAGRRAIWYMQARNQLKRNQWSRSLVSFDILSLIMVTVSLRPVPDVESQGVMVSPKCQRVEELKTGSWASEVVKW